MAVVESSHISDYDDDNKMKDKYPHSRQKRNVSADKIQSHTLHDR